MTDVPMTPFVMHGARDAMADGLVHIEEHVKGIEQAVVENPGLVFDLAKTLIESTCRTVLKERSLSYSRKDDLPKLLKFVTDDLSFLPSTASDAVEVHESLKRTLSGLKTIILGICELRNNCGFASHGSDSARPRMEGIQALLAAEAADTVVGFLYRVHRQNHTSFPATYDENSDFNESLDKVFGPFQIFEIELRPSEVLFKLEPESYRIYLAEFDPNDRSEPNASTSENPYQ